MGFNCLKQGLGIPVQNPQLTVITPAARIVGPMEARLQTIGRSCAMRKPFFLVKSHLLISPFQEAEKIYFSVLA
jgi:hypothetical protein